MNASRRWAYHFAKQVPCIACGGEHQRRLRYISDGEFVEAHEHTLAYLMSDVGLQSMDVWCLSCDYRMTTLVKRKILSKARQQRKREASIYAELCCSSQLASKYDEYTMADGTRMSKLEYIERLREVPCAVCGTTKEPRTYCDRGGTTEAEALFARWWSSITLDDIHAAVQASKPICTTCFVDGYW